MNVKQRNFYAPLIQLATIFLDKNAIMVKNKKLPFWGIGVHLRKMFKYALGLIFCSSLSL
ncbi:hypothetical protein AT245_01505 [Bartonella henselae]|nr:hypothetical protein AT244_07190 [Bartonella henselae]OLL44191.1 hypothetical protein AT245_01505 [Bartonella henselae]